MIATDIVRALGEALILASEGRRCFPCASSKRPESPRGFLNASADPPALHELWARYPGALVGVRTGNASGIDILDLDRKHRQAAEWWTAHRHSLPVTRVHRSRSGGLLQDRGDLAGARPLCERALAIDEKVLGPEHPDTATSLANLALLLNYTGHANEAEPLFRKAMAIGEKTLGPRHRLTQRYRSQYARLLLDTGRSAKALAFAQAALATHEATSGASHPWTKNSARVTAAALDALGRADEAAALRTRYGMEPDDRRPE